VASLLPSATEMVHLAGAGDSLVGVTHECDHPPGVERLPKLTSTTVDGRNMTSAEIDAAIGRLLTDSGSIYALDAALLEELAPDLVITQGLCDVCAVSMDVVERAVDGLKKRPGVISLNPTSLEEVLQDAVRIGEALGNGDETRRKVATLRERLDPPFSAGHWVPEMVSIAGGEEPFAGPGEPSAHITWEEVFAAAPEVLVLMPCGFDAWRAASEARALPGLSGWSDLPAVKNGRVWVVDANSYFSRPAPRLVEGVEILARVLHPEAFPDAPDPVSPTDAALLSEAVAAPPANR
jgi:iron complex transport system substrate-binding protein